MTMTAPDRTRVAVDRWLRAAVEDAERRGLAELKPLLEGLAEATVTLRAADWNDAMPGAGREEGGGRKGGGREEGGGREGGGAASGQAGGAR
jgi:uncharacterized membrane protein YgcG